MLGYRYLKSPPTRYVLHYSGGSVRREGPGLSFFYFAPWSTIVSVPVGSTDSPFIFTEMTADFQELTVQGHVTYRVAEPKKLAGQFDYSLRPDGEFASDDPTMLPERVTQVAQATVRGEIQARSLRDALGAADAIGQKVFAAMKASPVLAELGLDVMEFAVLAVRPVPDTAKALEAPAREQLMRESDDAIYERRNNAVEQERRIQENELNTQLAVEAKQRLIEEKKLAGKIQQEQTRRELVALEAENSKTRADAQAYAVEATIKPLAGLDPKALQVLAARSIDPRQMVAMAFQEIAANAQKVGTLNISPDLLDSLLQGDGQRKK